MKLVSLAVILLALSGCGIHIGRPKYVPIHCLTDEQYQQLRDAEPGKVHDRLTGKADEDIRVIAGSAVDLRSWGRGNLDVLGGCKG